MDAVSAFTAYAKGKGIALRPPPPAAELNKFANQCSLKDSDPIIRLFKESDGFGSDVDPDNFMQIWSISEIQASDLFIRTPPISIPIIDYAFGVDVFCVLDGKMYSSLREVEFDFGLEHALDLWIQGRVEDTLIWLE